MGLRQTDPFFLCFIAVIGAALIYQQLFPHQIDSAAIASRNPWFDLNIHRATEPVMVRFGGDWHAKSRCFDFQLCAVEPMFKGRMKILRVDVKEQPDLANAFRVRSIPHSFIVYRGMIITSKRGQLAQEVLENWMEQGLRTAYQFK